MKLNRGPAKIMKCHLCEFQSKRSSKIEQHMQVVHSYNDIEQAYADAFHAGSKQSCECGCGSNLRWESWHVGYPKKRVIGHNNAKSGPCIAKVVDTTEEKCPWCTFEGTRLAIRTHSSYVHGKTAQQTYDEMFLGGKSATCACGCGESPKFYGIQKGYSDYLRGHSQIIENNFHARGQESYDKLGITRKQLFSVGDLAVWNKGLTKEADDRVAQYGRTCSENFSKERKQEYSIRMSQNRRDGTVPTLYGKDHPKWRGGSSTLAALARSYLYKSWVYPKLEASNFACAHCSTSKDLRVHHDGERFATILQEAMVDLNYTGSDEHEEKSAVSRRVVQIHLERKVSGLVLCEKCHAIEHERLGENYNLT